MPFLATHFIARGYAFVPQDVRGKFRSEGDPLAFVGEVPDGYDTIEWITRQPWSNGDVGMWGDSYYGFTQWAAVACRAPRAQGDRPARHDRRHRRLARGRDAALRRRTTWPSTGPTTTRTSGRPTGVTGRWPRSSTRPSRQIGQALGVVRLRARALARRPSAFRCSRARIRSTCCGSRPCTASAGSTTSRRRTCSTTRRSCGIPRRRRSSTCTPARRITRTTASSSVPIPESEDHAQHDDALERMLARYIAPALDFFDAFLTGTADPAGVPRVRWHLAHVGWQESPDAGRRPARPSCASTSPTPGRATVDAEGGSLVAGAGRARRGRPGCTIPRTSCPRRSSIRSAPLLRVPGRARGRVAPRRADVHDASAGRSP